MIWIAGYLFLFWALLSISAGLVIYSFTHREEQ
jgi:hypothetical protein